MIQDDCFLVPWFPQRVSMPIPRSWRRGLSSCLRPLTRRRIYSKLTLTTVSWCLRIFCLLASSLLQILPLSYQPLDVSQALPISKRHRCLHQRVFLAALPIFIPEHSRTYLPDYLPFNTSNMKFLSIAAALFAATVTAQLNNAIAIPEGSSTLDVTAGEPLTIEWSNPSSGTVTIKLQQEPVTPDSGIVLLCKCSPHMCSLAPSSSSMQSRN